MKIILNLFLLCLLVGCQAGPSHDARFKERYSFSKDPFIPIYEKLLVSIEGEAFDSDQVSNKRLDPEMIVAIRAANMILEKPRDYAPDLWRRIERLGIEKITIASAARSPYLQERLSAKYKAGYLDSFHMLGLAVDLEMKGKSFDVKTHPKNEEILFNYRTLEMVLNRVGLVFSEPMEVDANHVELYRFCKKKNPHYDKMGLEQRAKVFHHAMLTLIESKLISEENLYPIQWEKLYSDLLKKRS